MLFHPSESLFLIHRKRRITFAFPGTNEICSVWISFFFFLQLSYSWSFITGDKWSLFILSTVVTGMRSCWLKCPHFRQRSSSKLGAPLHRLPGMNADADGCRSRVTGGFRGQAQEWQTVSLPRSSTGSASPHALKILPGKSFLWSYFRNQRQFHHVHAWILVRLLVWVLNFKRHFSGESENNLRRVWES